MSLQSRFFTILVFVIGCIAVPLMLLAFFFTLRALDPVFWTKGITAGGFVAGYIEDHLPNQKKVPVALKRNLMLAKNSIEESLQKHIEPQIEQQLGILKLHVQGEAAFPSLRFDLVRLKKDLGDDLREAQRRQSFTDKSVVNFAFMALGFVPDTVSLHDYLKIQDIKDYVAKNQAWLSFTLKYPYFFPLIVVIFLLLFVLTTLNIRNGLLYFSRLMIFSGFGLAILCALGMGVVALFDPFIKPWLLQNSVFYYDLTLKLSNSTVAGLTKYLLGTLCIQGFLAAGSGIVIGIIFFTKKKKAVIVSA